MNVSIDQNAHPIPIRSMLALSAAAAIALLSGCGEARYSAEEGAPAATATYAEGATGGVSGAVMMDNLMTQTGVATEKIMELAEAIGEESYGWRPMEGVRSASEVFIHIAADNYFIPVIMGVEAPSETGITMEYSTVQAFEAREMTKSEIIEALATSFAHLESAAESTGGDLSKEVAFGSNSFTVGGLWAMAVTHLHEHLGQSVAYARANEVVPPWSM